MKLEDLTFQPETAGPGYVIRWKEDNNNRAQTVPYVVGQILETFLVRITQLEAAVKDTQKRDKWTKEKAKVPA